MLVKGRIEIKAKNSKMHKLTVHGATPAPTPARPGQHKPPQSNWEQLGAAGSSWEHPTERSSKTPPDSRVGSGQQAAASRNAGLRGNCQYPLEGGTGAPYASLQTT